MPPTSRLLSHLHLIVHDLDRSLRFYGEALGFVERYRSRKGVVFLSSSGGGSIALEQADGGRAPGVDHFTFELGDPATIEAMLGRVAENGGSVLKRSQPAPGHLHAFVADPDGHVIRL